MVSSKKDEIDDGCQVYCLHPEMVRKAIAGQPSDQALQRLSEIFKTFGDPTRLRIINALRCCELCVCDLSYLLGMDSSAVSHQLRILRDRRIVRFQKRGKVAYYSLYDQHAAAILDEGLKHVNDG